MRLRAMAMLPGARVASARSFKRCVIAVFAYLVDLSASAGAGFRVLLE
jgi:hypothetical protein